MLNKQTILITGGTGSFGKNFVKELLLNHKPKSIRVFSRDELKQWEMANELKNFPNFDLLRFFIGDVRDKDRVKRAMEGADIVVHAAALKQIPTAEYNPMECIKTNILGAENVINAALDLEVKKVIALSTDKAASPINLYGATKLCSDKLFIAANNIKGKRNITFSVVRYGNVMGSRGSVVPLFLKKKKTGSIPITHPEMTRFNITLAQALDLVLYALDNSMGGEIFVPKIPSFKITDLAEAIDPSCKIEIIGIRPGEKLHEEMITLSDAPYTLKFSNHFVILPSYAPFTPAWDPLKLKKRGGKKVGTGFSYNSGINKDWLSVKQLRGLVNKHIKDGLLEE